MARPKKEVTKNEVVHFKLTKEEKLMLKEAAKKEGVPVSEFIRECIFKRRKK